MAKKTRGKKKKQPLDWGKIGRGALRTGSILMLVGLAIAMVFGIDRLRTHADGQLRLVSADGDSTGVEIRFNWPPVAGAAGSTWMIAEDQAELISVAQRAVIEDSPLSVAPLQRVAEALGRTGWFDGDPRVVRTGAGQMLVDGTWRLPAAVVRWRGADGVSRDYLVSDHAMSMPPVYSVGTSDYPFIEGVFSGVVFEGDARYALPWPGPGVSVGLDLIGVLRGFGLIGPVVGVDVSGYLDGGPIELVSKAGNRIVWGSPVDEWTPGEPSVDEKIARLVQLMQRTGAVDAGQRRIEIHRAQVEINRTGRD